MIFRNNQRKFIGAEQLVAQVRRMTRDEAETGVHPPFLQSRLDFRRRNFLDDQANGGVRDREQAEQIRNQCNIQNGHNAEVQHAAQLSGLASEVLVAFLQLAQYRPGMLLEDQAGRRKQNTFATPLKESNTKPGFEIPDLLGYTGLRNAETIRAAAEVTRLCYGQEVPQMAHLNRIVHSATLG